MTIPFWIYATGVIAIPSCIALAEAMERPKVEIGLAIVWLLCLVGVAPVVLP